MAASRGLVPLLALCAACGREPQVEALPLPDAEPPVVIVGPGRDTGVKEKAGKGKKKDASVESARDAVASADARVELDELDEALGRIGARASADRAPERSPDRAPERSPSPSADDDDVPLYVLDESESARSETPSPSPPRSASPSPPPSRSAEPAPDRVADRASPPPAGRVTTGARGPLVLVDGARGRLDVMSRDAELLGRIDVGGATVRGVAHDRRTGDGVWILVAGSPPLVAKLGWDGRRLKAFEVRRPPLRRARSFVGIDHVMGHSAASDLLLVLYVNKLGLPVVEGLSARDGTSRFSVGFSREANVSGVRADGFRHDTVDGLLVLDWWTIRQTNHLERWRFFYGFVDRIDDRSLDARIDAFDIPPWREVWGVDRTGRRVLRMSGDGDVVKAYPALEIEPTFVAITSQ